jgi:hypothetical protein
MTKPMEPLRQRTIRKLVCSSLFTLHSKVKLIVTLEFALSLTKYNDAAAIAHRVLAKVCKLAIEGDGSTILSLCEQGDKLLEEECAKVYKGKKISKGGSRTLPL